MDQASGLRQMVKGDLQSKTSGEKNKSTRVIAITSGKGGVGKTNIVGNLAIALAKNNNKVLVLDADLGLANIDIIYGIHPEYNIGHILSGEKELADVIVSAYPGVDVMPSVSGESAITKLTEGQKLNLLAEFETLDGIYDILLVDTAAGISDNVIYFNLAAEECIVVATGEPTSITDAYGIIKVMSGRGVKRFKLLVNMVKTKQEAKTVYLTLSQAADRFLNGVVIEFINYIPYDEKLKDAVIHRKPVIELHPDAMSVKGIVEVAGLISDSPRRPDSDGNIKFFMKRLMNQAQ